MVRSFSMSCRECERTWYLVTVAHADTVCPYCASRDVEAHETDDWPPRRRATE